MTKEEFAKGKELEERIKQMNVFIEYMKHLLANHPFKVEVKIQRFGSSEQIPIYDVHDTYSKYIDSEDGTYVMEMLEGRKAQLKKELDTLCNVTN